MSFLDGKVNDYFDDMFDFNKDGRLSMEEQAMQFDMVRDIEERNRRDSFWGSDDDSDGGDDD
ncbi:MAG: hypothetical protein IJJ25_01995 [Lachnospiraceae bacterium]|nr:hypothetical protein [Lachnospiraceae bacterium]